MDIEFLRSYCLSKPLATECFPFDDVTLVFKIMGKMFAVIPLDNPEKIVLKCDPDYAIELRERYVGVIEGAFHFNKRYWNQISLLHNVPTSLFKYLIDHSYEEVIAKFPKKDRAILGKG